MKFIAILILAAIAAGCMQQQTRVNPGQTPEVYRVNGLFIQAQYPARGYDQVAGAWGESNAYPCWQDPVTKTIYVDTKLPDWRERELVAKHYGVALP